MLRLNYLAIWNETKLKSSWLMIGNELN